MAFTLGRWISVVALCCALFVVFYYPRQTTPRLELPGEPGDRAHSVRRAEEALAREIRELKGQVELASIRDSLISLVPAAGRTGGPRVIAQPEASWFADLLQQALHSEWVTLNRPEAVPIGVFVRLASRLDWTPIDPVAPATIEVTTLPPDADTRFGCFRIVTIPEHHGILFSSTPDNIEYKAHQWGIDLGACGAYAMFGVPGPTVRAWLEKTNHRSATSVSRSLWQPLQDARDLFDYSPRALSCAGGNQATCLEIIAGETNVDMRAMYGENFEWIVRNRSINRPYMRLPVYGWDFAGAEAYLIDDVLREAGPERFAQFWSSTAPLGDALTTALNRDAGAWLSDWARERVGPVTPGPAPGGKRISLLLGATLLAFVAGIGAHLRRGR